MQAMNKTGRFMAGKLLGRAGTCDRNQAAADRGLFPGLTRPSENVQNVIRPRQPPIWTQAVFSLAERGCVLPCGTQPRSNIFKSGHYQKLPYQKLPLDILTTTWKPEPVMAGTRYLSSLSRKPLDGCGPAKADLHPCDAPGEREIERAILRSQ